MQKEDKFITIIMFRAVAVHNAVLSYYSSHNLKCLEGNEQKKKKNPKKYDVVVEKEKKKILELLDALLLFVMFFL